MFSSGLNKQTGGIGGMESFFIETDILHGLLGAGVWNPTVSHMTDKGGLIWIWSGRKQFFIVFRCSRLYSGIDDNLRHFQSMVGYGETESAHDIPRD